MLVFADPELAYIAVPKTGTTAISRALRGRADILFTKRYKHMTARRFHGNVAPFLKEFYGLDIASMAVMRDPEETARSWYRFRQRNPNSKSGKGTHVMSFDEFVLDIISKSPSPAAKIGSQINMLTSHGEVVVNHLFSYDAMPVFLDFLETRFGEPIIPQQMNVSPQIDAPLSPKIRTALRDARAEEFALYDRLQKAGGYLHTAPAAVQDT